MSEPDFLTREDSERIGREAANRPLFLPHRKLKGLIDAARDVVAHEVLNYPDHRKCVNGCVLCELAKAIRALEPEQR